MKNYLKLFLCFLAIVLFAIHPVQAQDPRYLAITLANEDDKHQPEKLALIQKAHDNGCNAVLLAIQWGSIHGYVSQTLLAENGANYNLWKQYDDQIAKARSLGMKVGFHIVVSEGVYVGTTDRYGETTSDGWLKEERMLSVGTSGQEAVYQQYGGEFRPNVHVQHVMTSLAAQSTQNRISSFATDVMQRYGYLLNTNELLYVSLAWSRALEGDMPYQNSKGDFLAPIFSDNELVLSDYSQPTVVDFRNWLSQKYGTIGVLNTAWGTNHSNFDAINPKRPIGSFQAAFDGRDGKDWFLYRTHILKKVNNIFKNAVKLADSRVKVITHHGSVFDRLSMLRHSFSFNEIADGFDGIKINDDLDFDHRFALDLIRTNLPNKSFYINEGHYGGNINSIINLGIESYNHGANIYAIFNSDLLFERQSEAAAVSSLASNYVTNHQVTKPTPTNTHSFTLSSMINHGGCYTSNRNDYYADCDAYKQWNAAFSANSGNPVNIFMVNDLTTEKIVFVGNSMTSHGPNSAIGWSGDWGMAASAQNKDYVHLVSAALNMPFRISGGGLHLESEFSNLDLSRFNDDRDFLPTKIIIRIGENATSVNSGNLSTFKSKVKDVVQFIKNGRNNVEVIITTTFWRESDYVNQNSALRQAAAELGARLVELSDLEDTPNMTAAGLFSDLGVAKHPSDAGMYAIAQRILGNCTTPSAPQIGGSGTVCATSSQTVALSTSSSCSGGTISWYKDGNATGGTGTSYTVSQPGSYTAKCTVGTCVSDASNSISIAQTAGCGANCTGAIASGGTGTGLRGRYFNSFDWTGTYVLERTDAGINFDWGSNSPGAGVNADFSVRWEGQVEIPEACNYQFQTSTDDGVHLWIDGVQYITDGTNHGELANATSSISLSAGLHTIRMDYFDSAGGAIARLRWAKAGQSFELIPSSRLYLPSSPGTGTGLTASYFNNMSLTAPASVTRIDETVNFVWSAPPASGFTTENFSVRWEGEVEAPVSGTYIFKTNNDDGTRLWVNGVLLIDDWNGHPPTEKQGTISLTGGQKYSIKKEYYQGAGGAQAQLSWEYPGQSSQIIPKIRLYPTTPVSAGCDFTLSASNSNSTPYVNQPLEVSYGCTGADCGGVSYSWSGNGVSGSTSPLSITAPGSAGTYTYTVTGSKSGCSSKTANTSVTVGTGGGCVVNKVRLKFRSDCCLGRLVGTTIQGSNDNTNWTTLYTISVNATGAWQEFTFSNSTAYSHVKYVAGPDSYGELNELEFYSNNQKLTGDFFSSSGYDNTYYPSNAMDGDESTLWHGNMFGSAYNYVGLHLSGCTGPCTPPSAPGLTASPSSISAGGSSTLTATGCSGTVTWSTGATGSPITVSPSATTTYTATCTVSGCTSGNGSVTLPVCNYSEGQYLSTFTTTGEQVYAHYCGSTLYATTNPGSGGLFKPASWLQAIGFSGYSCFTNTEPNLGNCNNGNCDFTLSASNNNSTPYVNQPLEVSYGCTGADCGGVSYSWSGNGVSGSTSPLSITAPGSAGTYTYTVTGSKSGCSSKTASTSVTVGSPGTGTGLTASYFNNMSLTAPASVTRVDETVNFVWSAPPASGFTTEYFSVRWEGEVEAPVSGTYTFKTNNDDGTKLWVNGVLLIDDWNGHAPTEKQGTISLTGGQKYSIKKEYYQGAGGAQAQLFWEYSGQSQQVIPKTRLYPSSTPNSTDCYQLYMAGNSKRLTNYNGIVKVDDSNGSNSQIWKLVDAGSGYVKIKSEGSTNGSKVGYVLGVRNSGSSESNLVDLQTDVNGDHQLWLKSALTASADAGRYKIERKNTSLRLGSYRNWGAGILSDSESDIALASDPNDVAGWNKWLFVNATCPSSPCTPPSAPSLTASSAGGSSTLTASGCSGTVTWSTGATGTQITVSPSTTTTYTATCTVSGCTSSNGSVMVTPGSTVNCSTIQGVFEGANCINLGGWAYDSSNPNTVINVDVYEGTTLILGNSPAGTFRQDLVNAGIGNGYHGFNISTPSSLKNGQNRSITIKVTGCSSAVLWNSPQTINCSSGGSRISSEEASFLAEPSDRLLVSPNPNNGDFEVNFSVDPGQKTEVTVSNMLGSPLYQHEFSEPGSHKERIRLRNISAGTYLLLIRKNREIQTKKIVVIK